MSLKLKTIFGVALIEAVLLIFLVTVAVQYLRETNYEGMEKRASTAVQLFAVTTQNAVLSYDLATLESLVVEVRKNPDVLYARVFDNQNRLLAQDVSFDLENHLFVPDFVVADVSDGIFDAVEDIIYDGVVFGHVEVGFDVISLNKKIEDVQNWTRSIALLEMLLVAFFSYVLGTYLTSQLSALQASSKAISEGDLDIQVPVNSNDEVGQLANAFNIMVENLRSERLKRDSAEEELKQLNQSLELRVKERTRALQFKNMELETASSEIKKTQNRLVQSEKMASLGVMAAGVAHEINNPVGFITSNVSTLNEYIEVYHKMLDLYDRFLKAENSAERDQILDAIKVLEHKEDLVFIRNDMPMMLDETKKGLERVRNIVKDLREFSHSNPDNKFTPTNLNDIIKSTINIAKTQYDKTIEVDYYLDENLPMVSCDRGKIGQVLLNLVTNAYQALGAFGVLTLRSKVQEGYVVIDVIDNGMGMNDTTMEKIFDPFFTTKAVGTGTGLGLAICFTILAEHNGQILVQSKLGEGSVFTIKLPL